MKKILNYRSFLESLNAKVGKANLLGFKHHDVLDDIELYKVTDKVWAVKVTNRLIRAALFLRYQEFYESPTFKNQHFDIDTFVKDYMQRKPKNGAFTYGYDWCGFNIPSKSIDECLSDIKSPNEYDRIMNLIVNKIKEFDSKFYLLGVDTVESDLLEHELAHGFYFTNSKYKMEMDQLIDKLPKDTYNNFRKLLLDVGYDESVVYDEIQAYMSTGLSFGLKNLENINKHCEPFIELFKKYYVGKIEPKQITIDLE